MRRAPSAGGGAPPSITWTPIAWTRLRSSSKVRAASAVADTGSPARRCASTAQATGPPPMVTPVSSRGPRSSVARLPRSAATEAGAGLVRHRASLRLGPVDDDRLEADRLDDRLVVPARVGAVLPEDVALVPHRLQRATEVRGVAVTGHDS